MADKIQVAVRVRPVLFQKKDVEVHWGCDKGMIYQIDPGTRKRLGNPYLFDQVFEPHTQNHQIFASLVQPLIDSAMDGFNVTVLAYGQTASGKTYTMMGSQKECGIVQLAVDRIFSTIEQNPERAFLLRCSYIEIYNETISDLLSTTHQKLKLQELAEGNVIVHNLIETNVNSPDSVIKLMQQGNKQRKVGGTSMNERSSRSHTIFRIIVESVPRAEADRSDAAVMVSHINLVDLAGSEKASQTHATGDRFREGCAINTSLSALSLVIKQLSEGEGFVNFRDSKLTHILRASLGGNARTAIICNVTPTVLDETSSTLKFACSAKTVQNQPHVNEVLSDQALLRKYNNYIKDLEKKLKEKEQEQRPEALEEMERLLQEKEMKIQELKEKLVTSSVNTGGDNQMSASQRSLRRMTWGGNRLKQMLNFPPAPVFENAPVFASVGINRTRRVSFKSRKSDPSSFEDIAEGDSMDSESFVPAEVVFAKPGEPVTKVDAATMTELPQASPFRKPFESPFRRPQTPGTPVPVLRERMMQLRKTLEEREQENSDLREELEDLSNFTRLEQQIGVHVQATAKTCTSQDTAEQLHQALQTANDMEVLYLDTQRKLSELQTQFREKEVEHANEVESLTADFQQRLDGETSERKRLARELSVLKEKHERLERDQAEADTHLQVVTERHVKREADLRQSLQEAWAQLEGAGQDPAAFREGLAAKEQVVQMGKEIEEMQSKYEEAQAQIRALSEELKCAKETANESALVATDQVGKMSKEIEEMQSKYEEAQAQILALSEELKHHKETTVSHVFTSPKVDELDSSLGGVCLADELRDVFMEQDSSLVRSSVRPRKRPSSILSVALAKMEQSACMLDGEQDVHPVKKTRFSVASMQTEDLDIREVKEIREYLVELQAVLVRYEEDYEILSQEKEAIVNQLIATQKEVASLREAPSFTRTTRRSSAREDLTPDKIDAFSEDFEASCIMEEHSVVASNAETELTGDAVSTPGESRAPQETVAVSLGQELLNEELDQLKRPNEILESSLLELTGKLQLLQEEIEAKTSALEAAVSASRTLEMVIEEKDEVISSLRKVNDDVLTLRDESQSLMDELENTRSALAETRSKLGEVTEEKESCSSKLSEVNEELESIKNELKIALEQIQTSQEQLLQSNSLALEMDLAKAHDRIRELEVEIELKTSEVEGIRASLEEASRRTEELELRSVNESNGELATALNKIKELEAEIEIKTSEVQAVQTALEQACVRAEELERKAADDSNEQLATALKKIAELEEELNVKISETETAQMRIKEASSDLQVLKNELNAKEDELNAVKAELAEVRGAVEKFSEEKQERISSLEAEIAQANDQIKALGARLEEAASCDQQETDCSEREKLEELVERLTCQLEELEQKVEEKDQLLNDARDAAYQTSVQQKEATEAERQKCQKEVDALTEQSNDLRVQLEALSAELERVKQELLDSSAQVGELLLSKQSLELQLQSAEQKLGESKEEASGNAAVESAHISKLETELEEARKRIEELQFSNDFLQADLTSAEVRSGELEAQLDAKNEALRRAESANDALDEIRQQLTVKVEQVGELRTKLEEADIQIADLCSQREEVQAKLNEAKQRVQSLEEDVESERDALFATQRAAKEASEVAEAKLTELEAEKAVLIQQLDVATKEVEKLQLSVETVTTELQAARAQIATLEESNRLNSVPRENLTALEQEWKEALLKVSELESLLETETSKFDDARQNMEAAQSEVEQLNGQLKKYSAEIESLQRNIGDLSNRNASQNEHIEQLETNLRAMEDEVSNLRTSSGKISALENQLEALNGEIAHLSRVIEEKTEKINSLEDELTYVSQGEQCRLEQIQHMEKKLKERQVELEETRCLLVSMQTENEKISFDLSDKENQNVELRKSLGDFNQRFDTVQAKLEAVQAEKSRLALQLQRLEAEVDCREQELQGLRGGMESLHHEREMCQQLKQRLSALQSEKEAAVQLCERLREARDELVKQQDRLTQHVQELESKLQTSEWAKKNVEQTLAHYDSEKDALLKNHQRLKEELVLAEGRWKEETRRMAGELQAATSAKETLERIVAQYESQKETLVQEYQRLKEALLSTEERLGGEVRQLSDHLKASNAARNALEQDMAQFEGLKEASKQMKKTLADTEEQLKVVQAQRDEYLYQLKALSEQMLDARAKISAFESTSKYQTQRQLEDMIDALKRELVETRSSGEISRLNYEKEEENKKKKIERLEKEFEALKQQYVKCKEQLRLSRYKENEEGTVSIPKMRSSSSTTSTFVQTDPIADKGFGFRWQADRYSADNERLRVKVSELGERMEYYKEKLIKYRSLYFQAIGQDPNQRPHSGNSNPIQHLERRSSTSSSLKEHAIDNPVKEGSENVVRGRPLAPSSSLSSGLLETEQRDPARGVQTRSSTGSLPVGASRLAGMKKEALTKEEMEKINNCNPS